MNLDGRHTSEETTVTHEEMIRKVARMGLARRRSSGKDAAAIRREVVAVSARALLGEGDDGRARDRCVAIVLRTLDEELGRAG